MRQLTVVTLSLFFFLKKILIAKKKLKITQWSLFLSNYGSHSLNDFKKYKLHNDDDVRQFKP